MPNTDNNVATLPTSTDATDVSQSVSDIRARHITADKAGQVSALEYLGDADAQRKRHAAKYKKAVVVALESDDIAALTKLVKQAKSMGIKL